MQPIVVIPCCVNSLSVITVISTLINQPPPPPRLLALQTPQPHPSCMITPNQFPETNRLRRPYPPMTEIVNREHPRKEGM